MSRCCSSCGLANDDDARFCDRCGSPLATTAATPAPRVPAPPVTSNPPRGASSARRAIIVGADAACAVVANDPRVSSEHAVLWGAGDEAWVADLGSTNGTFVDGQRLTRPVRVTGATAVTLGGFVVDVATTLAHLAGGAPAVLVGRDPGADIVLDAPTVSTLHALLVPSDERVRVIDLQSANGTTVGDHGARLQRPAWAAATDVVRLGSLRLPLETALRSVKTTPVGVRVGSAPVIVGRHADCEIVVPYPQVSGRHARLTPQGDGSLLVEDLGSANGTYLNGARVQRGVWRPGDRLALASYPIHIDQQLRVRPSSSSSSSLRLDARGLSLVTRDRETGQPKRLLNDVSFSIYPSEFVALMGPSGAGKTTLLKALNGYESPTSGQVLIGGEDFHANFERFRTVIGYVPQDDTLYGELTVREALTYTARLRLPPDTTDDEIAQRVERVASDLNLVPQLKELIGSVEKKVLSGGQRKRVNLAQELISDPPVLFLDEPTSGLSSRDTADVMNVLRKLADEGRTIIVTIHQPAREVYEKLDHVIYMVREDDGARVAFFGPTAPDSYAFFGTGADPDAIMTKLSEKSAGWPDRYRASPQHQTYVAERLGEPARADAKSLGAAEEPPQFGTLLSRYTTLKRRDRGNVLFMAAQAPVVSFLLALLFHDATEHPLKRDVPLFVACIATLFFGCFNASREIVSDRVIFTRERMVNLRLFPYLLTRFALLGTVGLLQTFAILLVLIPSLGLRGSFVAYFLTLGLTSISATALGLVVSSLVPSAATAQAVAPLLMIPQIVLGGMMVPLRGPGEFTEVLAAFSPSRWATEALLDVERDGLENKTPPSTKTCKEIHQVTAAVEAAPPGTAIDPIPEDASWRSCSIQAKDLTAERRGIDLFVLTGMTVFFLGGALVFLGPRRRNS